MSTLSRVVALVALVGAVSVVAVPSASAQSSIPAADAQAFLGSWALEIDAQGQVFTMDLNIKDASGSVAADISSDMGDQAVSEIARDGEDLVLSYTAEAQGQEFPVVITLTPAGADLNAEIDFADGMFTANGKGKKK